MLERKETLVKSDGILDDGCPNDVTSIEEHAGGDRSD